MEYQDLKRYIIRMAKEREKNGRQTTRWDATLFSQEWSISAWECDKVVFDFRKVMEIITELYEVGILI